MLHALPALRRLTTEYCGLDTDTVRALLDWREAAGEPRELLPGLTFVRLQSAFSLR